LAEDLRVAVLGSIGLKNQSVHAINSLRCDETAGNRRIYETQ
jgi:hypothetical protein